MVIIIGAGLAGLTCAKVLHQRGLRDLLLLEAAPQPGGRLASTRTRDGLLLDRGFQVLLDSYPAARRHLDIPALQPRHFDSGALIADAGRLIPFDNPLRSPARALPTLLGHSLMEPADKLALAALGASLLLMPDDAILAAGGSDADTSASDYLAAYGFSQRLRESFFHPFFGGVLLDPDLRVSASLLRYYLKSFLLGRALLPANGIRAIPDQLAATLPDHLLRLSHPVTRVLLADTELSGEPGPRVTGVQLPDNSTLPATAVILATDEASTARLLPWRTRIPRPATSVTVAYYLSQTPLYRDKKIVLPRGRDRLVRHFAHTTNPAPEHAPPGLHLLSATILDTRGLDDDRLLHHAAQEIRHLFPHPPALEPVEILHIPRALPFQPPGYRRHLPLPASRTTPGLFLAGDQAAPASIQSAIQSGEDTATLCLKFLKTATQHPASKN